MQPNLLKSSAHGILWQGSSQAFLIVIRLLVMIVLARFITPKEFGLAELVLLIIGFSDMIAGMGILPAIVQRKDLNDEHLSAGFVTIFLLSLFFAIAFFLLAPAIATYTEYESLTQLLQFAVLLFPINACTVVPKALMLRNLKFKQLALVEMVAFTVGYGLVGIVMALMGYGAVTLLAASIARASLYLVLLWRFTPRISYCWPGRLAYQELLSVGPGYGIAQIGNYLARNADRVVVFQAFGAAAMGIYGRAFMLSEYPERLLGQTMDHVLFPVIASCQDDMERVKKAFCRGSVLFAAFSFPATIPLIVASDEIVSLVLGPQWVAAGPVFQILAFLLVIRFLNKLNECLTRAAGAVYRRAWRIWLHLPMILFFAWMGTRVDQGLVPVAIGVGIAALLNYIQMTQLSLELLGLSWSNYFKQFVRPGTVYAITLVATGAVAMIVRRTTHADILVLVSSLLVPILVYATLLLKNPNIVLGAESNWILNALWSTVPSRLRGYWLVQRMLHQQPAASP